MAAPLEPGENQILLNGKLYNLNTKRSPQDIVRQDLQTFPAPATIGPADYNTDPVTAVWVMSDFSGGMGVEDITGSDTTRFRWGTADARFPGAITLGPLVTQTRPSGIVDADLVYPVGDIPGTNPEFYIHVNVAVGTDALYAWNEASDTWRGATIDIGGNPADWPRIQFRGTNANNQLYIRVGGLGTPLSLRTTGSGVVASATPGSGTGYGFVVWDNKIWAMNLSNVLKYSFDGTTFTAVTDPSTGTDLALDLSQLPWQLISWFNLAGESSLYVISADSIWAYNGGRGAFEHVADIPFYPIATRPAAVWRSSEDLWVGVGPGIIRRTPAGVTVPLAGPGADADGLPSGFIGRVYSFATEHNALFATFHSTAVGQKGSIILFNGNGWFPLWEAPDDDEDIFNPYVSKASSAYRLWWGYGSYAYTIQLRQAGYSARQGYAAGIDEFAASSYIETGRFWGQTQGFYKLAHRLEVFMDHATSTEKVTVYYQTDTVTSWTQLGSAVTTGRDTVPASAFTTLYFGTADANGIYPGIRFNWIKFKYEFARGGTTTNTPVFVAGAFHFVKLRDSTPSITVDLDFTEDVGGRTPGQQKSELRALANSASQFYTLREGMNVYGVIVASFVDYGASGADQRGNGSISIVAVQATQVS